MAFNSTITEIFFRAPELVAMNFGENMVNILVYSMGMVLYAIILLKFYVTLSKRNLFDKEIKNPHEGFLQKVVDILIFLFRQLIIFPFISFMWFLVLSGFLLFLSKSQDAGQILLMSMTIIAASRITAYYNEKLSEDVAKLIPLSLMGVFIVDPTYFSMEATMAKFTSIPLFLHMILQYLLFIAALEFVLHVGYRFIKSE